MLECRCIISNVFLL